MQSIFLTPYKIAVLQLVITKCNFKKNCNMFTVESQLVDSLPLLIELRLY